MTAAQSVEVSTMSVRVSAEVRHHKRAVRFSLLTYSLFALLVTGVYALTHLRHFAIDWSRYLPGSVYAAWVDGLRPQGLTRLAGNEQQLHSPLLLTVLILGMVISLALILVVWPTVHARTLLPLIAFAGYLLPLLPPYDSNMLIRLCLSFLLILLGAVCTTFSLRDL